MADSMTSNEPLQETVGQLLRTYGSGAFDETKLLLASLRPSDVANLLSSLPPGMRALIWEILPPEAANQSLQHLEEDVRGELLDTMDTSRLVAAADTLDTDDYADILHQLPARITDEVLTRLDAADRARGMPKVHQSESIDHRRGDDVER